MLYTFSPNAFFKEKKTTRTNKTNRKKTQTTIKIKEKFYY